MSSGSTSNSPPLSPAHTRRPSVPSAPRLSTLLGRSPPSNESPQPVAGPIATAAAQASAQQRRRTSLAGLAGSPTNSSSIFSNGQRNRNSSMGSSNSPNSSIEECAIDEGDGPAIAAAPHSPFARRMSFGTKALHDSRSGGNSAATESYNWSEQIRSRAERSASLSQRQQPPIGISAVAGQDHHKAASVAIPEQPAKEVPRQQTKPDHFQERILKGDFYMD